MGCRMADAQSHQERLQVAVPGPITAEGSNLFGGCRVVQCIRIFCILQGDDHLVIVHVALGYLHVQSGAEIMQRG